MIRVQTLTSPLGDLTLAEEDGCIIGLWLEGQKHFPDLSNAIVEPSPVLLQAEQWLKRYFDGQRPQLRELPLNFHLLAGLNYNVYVITRKSSILLQVSPLQSLRKWRDL